jgi:hypothetical protein
VLGVTEEEPILTGKDKRHKETDTNMFEQLCSQDSPCVLRLIWVEQMSRWRGQCTEYTGQSLALESEVAENDENSDTCKTIHLLYLPYALWLNLSISKSRCY